jgi:hypothetical protein
MTAAVPMTLREFIAELSKSLETHGDSPVLVPHLPWYSETDGHEEAAIDVAESSIIIY